MSFRLHVLRCSYQIMIWKEALTGIVKLPDPKDYGHVTDADTCLYVPRMVNQPLAPPQLLNDLICVCEDVWSEACVCASNEQPCTQACDCTQAERTCQNVYTVLASIPSQDIID